MLRKILILLLTFTYISFGQNLKIAVLSYGEPIKEYKRYSVFADYLSQKLNRKVDLIIVEDVDKVFQLFRTNEVQMAVGCSVVYFELKRQYNVEAIAVMKINGKAVENGVLVVKKDSDINSIQDVKGKKITLGSPICMSNCVMPLYMLANAGITQHDVINIWSSGTDKGAILAVMSGIADVAGVKEESIKNYQQYLKVIARSPSFPRHIIMVSKNLDPKLYKQIENAIFSIDSETLKSMEIDGFAKPQPNMFEIIKNYRKILELFPVVR
ncbi:MAG TPA: phosphate/phosphite/phosphonate ABC transporter substrate-binding protein [Sulfurihydrogenibium azorense]|uniref:Phosphate/phosphite/phosphonate ABC transporter substrate-binding protein n=1 Tax=Sulfurihydrogenibium azorense TaxID=309806 RepID=A0A832DQK0_9AQUI|nr:MAG: phosphonate ABC transporter substrate-binding protein [Sulfurihydrogenibium sp.]HEV09199.1 phosphate/phosphite/phosphonate ABC transporter substrate-binding protein [Sulfurihydrogenibium azorense]